MVLAPTAKEAPGIDHYHATESAQSPNNEKASSSHRDDHEHRDTKHDPESEGMSDIHTPNMYVEALLLNPFLANTNRSPSRSDPFPIDPNAPEETHQLTIRALVVGGILGAIGKQVTIPWEFSPNKDS